MKSLIGHTLILTLVAAPYSAVADLTAPSASPAEPVKLKNVELSEAGDLAGQFVTFAGLPVSAAEVAIRVGKQTHKVTTDQAGKFTLKGLSGGRCIINAGKEVFACQLWAHGTAPPGSIDTIAVVASEHSEVRGNMLFWPPPYIPVPASLAALPAGTVVLGGAIIAGATIGVIEATDDGEDAS